MRTLKHILLPMCLGVIAWGGVTFCAYGLQMFEALGIKGGYNVRHGNEEAIPFGIALMLAFGIDTILNGVLGYCLAETTNPRHKATLFKVTALLILGVPLMAHFWAYVADRG